MSEMQLRDLRCEDIDSIRPLWEELNRHHGKRSPHFSDFYRNFTWETRRKELLKKAARGSFRIITGQDPSGPVAYCIANLDPEGTGEIDSVYVGEGYRGRGIGSRLIEAALDWFSRSGAEQVIVTVAAGNEDVFPFYARFGLFPRKTVLQKK